MIRVRIYLLLMLAIFLHITILDRFRIFNSKPDIVFTLVIFSGLFLGPRIGLEVGIVSGFLRDLFTVGTFGLSAVIFGIAGYLVSKIGPKVYRELKLTQFVLVFTFYLLAASAHHALKFVVMTDSSLLRDCVPTYWEFFTGSFLPTSIYTSVISLPLFGVLMRYFGFEEHSLA